MGHDQRRDSLSVSAIVRQATESGPADFASVASAPAPLDPSRIGPPPGARVIVAGGCGGMGRALVRSLFNTGMQVAVLDQSSALRQHPPPEDVR